MNAMEKKYFDLSCKHEAVAALLRSIINNLDEVKHAREKVFDASIMAALAAEQMAAADELLADLEKAERHANHIELANQAIRTAQRDRCKKGETYAK